MCLNALPTHLSEGIYLSLVYKRDSAPTLTWLCGCRSDHEPHFLYTQLFSLTLCAFIVILLLSIELEINLVCKLLLPFTVVYFSITQWWY
jgi:hypothetical protein